MAAPPLTWRWSATTITILLDVLLPQLNGMEVLRRVRKHKDVPVIMVTARDARDGQGGRARRQC